ncbi:DsbA family protein [Erythrobacter alti]|uniref:DsbA family protein n=1 Tax=Erythrobacter alti TaxID=1896145 RepID=UPI0030F4306E
MNFRRFVAAPAAAIVALAVPATPALAQDWNAQIVETDKGFRVGNPEAPLQLIEFVSYTCPHCAHFEQESEAELKYVYVLEGLAAVEVRHLLRNPIDVAVALVTECGATENFFQNHRALLHTQPEWLARAQDTSPAQQARWTSGTIAARMRAIGNDLDLHEIMEGRGYTFTQVDNCLADSERALAMVDASAANAAEFNVQGTPSFVLNGNLLDGVHDWASLVQIMAPTRESAMTTAE